MVESRTYLQRDVAAFLRTSDTFGFFSNMHSGYPMEIMGASVPSTEAWYQACRFPHLTDFQQDILSAKTPILAKRLAYTRVSETRSDWQKARISAMRHSLRLRFAHYPEETHDIMLATQGRDIVEISYRDSFWGAKPEGDLLLGCNVLGRLWMEMRLIVLEHGPNRYDVAPADIPDFKMLGQTIGLISPEPVLPTQSVMDL